MKTILFNNIEMKIPHLMPFQMDPFNGDHFIQKKFLELRDKFDIKTIVETGTCLGSSTLFFAKHFENVITIEANLQYQAIAINRCAKEGFNNIEFLLGDSSEILFDSIRPLGNETVMFFLDAHWGNNCPLIAELQQIEQTTVDPVIAIHDFYTGDERLGFDSIPGQRFDYEWILPTVSTIGFFEAEYNSFEQSAGAKRGIIYLTPAV
jgi:hypothetical protein